MSLEHIKADASCGLEPTQSELGRTICVEAATRRRFDWATELQIDLAMIHGVWVINKAGGLVFSRSYTGQSSFLEEYGWKVGAEVSLP